MTEDSRWHTFRYVAVHALPFVVLFCATFVCCMGGGAITRDGGAVVFSSIAGVILGLVIAAIPVLGFVLFSRFSPPKGHHVVLREKDGRYLDLGPGNKYPGLLKFRYELDTYDPKPRIVKKQVRLQTRNSKFVEAEMTYTWRPDSENLTAFFSANQEARIESLVTTQLSFWAKTLSPRQIFSETPESLAGSLPGVNIGGPFLTNLVASGQSDMSGYIRDDTALIESAIGEIESEGRLEAVRAALKEAYPDREHRIDRLIANRLAKLQKRGLREDR